MSFIVLTYDVPCSKMKSKDSDYGCNICCPPFNPFNVYLKTSPKLFVLCGF